MAEVVYSKMLRISITDAGIFFAPKKVESIFTPEQYQKSKFIPDYISYKLDRGEDIPDDRRFQYLYSFKETVPGIYNMCIGPSSIQIDFKDLSNDTYLSIIRQFLEKEDVCWLSSINSITCKCVERYISKTYEELSEYDARYLPDALKEHESEVERRECGELDNCDYEISRVIQRCRASHFHMADCISFTNTVITESLDTKGPIRTIDEFMNMLITARTLSEKLI